MTKKFWERVKRALRIQKHRSRWYKLMYGLALVVVFCTTYALILPAVTMETSKKSNCGLEEHTHTEECYEERQQICCELVEDESHIHTESCYEIEMVSVCNLEEHVHTEECNTGSIAQPENTETADQPEEPVDNVPQPEVTETTGQPEDTEAAVAESKDSAVSLQETNDQSELTEHGTSNVMLTADVSNTENETPSNADGFPLGNTNIQSIIVSMKNGEVWEEITEQTVVPGDAELQVKVQFHEVPKEELKSDGYKIIYEIPEFLRLQDTSGEIEDSEGNKIGTIVVSGRQFALKLEPTWVDRHQDMVEGKFTMQAGLNLSYIKDHIKDGTLVLGNLNLKIDDVDEWVTKYSSLEVTKELQKVNGSNQLLVEHKADGDYLTYMLTAAAGPDGVGNAQVKDYFTAGAASVAEYVGVTESPVSTDNLQSVTEARAEGKTAGTVSYDMTGTDAVKPGTLVWQIGAMDPGEVRTLTYQVKLADGYSGKIQKSIITNQADVYSGNYKRDETVANFEPKGGATIKKEAEFHLNPDGIGGTVTYSIWVKALETNNFTISNVKLYDFFVKSKTNGYKTQVSPEYVTLPDKNSFVLKDKDGKQLSINSLNPADNEENPAVNAEKKSFVCYIGDMKPGEEKTLQYTVTLDASAFLTNKYLDENGSLNVCNRAGVFPGGEMEAVSGGKSLSECMQAESEKINHYTWSSKAAVGEALLEERSIEIGSGAEVYKVENGVWTEESAPASFLVPKGSVEYDVRVNENAYLPVNQVKMIDTLDNNLVYAGYIKVSAFKKQSGAGQYTAVDFGKVPERTIWLKADGLKTFSFSPEDLGFTEDIPYAYKMTYYASPVGVNPGDTKIVGNSFKITGQVGSGGKYQLDANGITVSALATVHGSSSFEAMKRGWYYKRPAQGAASDWERGELYWYIELSGTSIPAGTSLKDIPGEKNQIKSDSLVGVYFGTLSEAEKDCSVLESMTKLTENVDYTAVADTAKNELTITFSKEYPLKDGSVYIIVKTSPSKLPGKLEFLQYENGLSLRDNDGNYQQNQQPVSLTVAGDDGISKEAKMTFLHNEANENKSLWATGGHNVTSSYLDLAQITVPGIYTEWLVTVNRHGNLSGDYLVKDQLPEGLEPVYVRTYSFGKACKAKSPVIEKYHNLPGWTEYSSTNRSPAGTTFWYYNADTGQVCWAVNGLTSSPVTEGGTDNTQTAQYQIVCRVTDRDVLLGGEAKSIENHVTLEDSSGNQVGNDFDSVSLTKRTPLSKESIEGNTLKGNLYPFTITLNEDGIDLMPEGDTIRLVDEMSKSLTLNPDTIQVFQLMKTGDTQTKEKLTEDQYQVQLEEQILTIKIPDNLPLEITYSARINAAPGTPVYISNNAHWEGYQSSQDTVVTRPGLTYEVSAVVGSEDPSLQIYKRDANDMNAKLSGAEFTVQEVSVDYNDSEKPVLQEPTGEIHIGKTDETGSLIFPESSENWMKYNVVYKLVEIKAPTGYVLDTTPFYFALASEDESTSEYPIFPEEVEVGYGISKFVHYVKNQKGVINVEKSFEGIESGNVSGTYTFGVFQEGENTPLQLLTITYEKGKEPVYKRDGAKAASPSFHNLDLTKTYKVRELDSDGNPIENGGNAWIENQCFEVLYENADHLQPSKESSVQTKVTIKNRQLPTYVMPGTGGTGTVGYQLAGLAIMVGTGIGYYKKSRKKSKT